MSWGHSRRPQEAGPDRDRQHGRALAAFHARRERDIVLQARFNLWISSEVRRLAHALGGDRASPRAGPGLLGTHSDLATPGAARLAEEGEMATSAHGSLSSPPPRTVEDTLAAIPDQIHAESLLPTEIGGAIGRIVALERRLEDLEARLRCSESDQAPTSLEPQATEQGCNMSQNPRARGRRRDWRARQQLEAHQRWTDCSSSSTSDDDSVTGPAGLLLPRNGVSSERTSERCGPLPQSELPGQLDEWRFFGQAHPRGDDLGVLSEAGAWLQGSASTLH